MPAREYTERHSVLYRWCHSDLVNSEFQYQYGLNMHPNEDTFRDPQVHLDVILWGMPAAELFRFPGHGSTLCRVELPDDALVYEPVVGGSFKASRMYLSEACALCVMTREAQTHPGYQHVTLPALLEAMGMQDVVCTCPADHAAGTAASTCA